MVSTQKKSPPGRTNIMKALTTLLADNDFHSITTASIAREAGVTEGLIYKYFKDKKDLLYQVLGDNFSLFYDHVAQKLPQNKTCVQKLKTIIRTTIKAYVNNRVFARIILLEVRNSPDYFDCPAYDMVKLYSSTILDLIRQGQESGEIRGDVDPYAFRKIIFGAMEHACLGEVIFNREMNPEQVADQINTILFAGVQS
ncbi:MAG: TetR/AcrR family transcriptional regulator [Pseudomonadota bacterium]